MFQLNDKVKIIKYQEWFKDLGITPEMQGVINFIESNTSEPGGRIRFENGREVWTRFRHLELLNNSDVLDVPSIIAAFEKHE